MPKKPPRTIRFLVPNIMCSGCAQTIKSLLKNNKKLSFQKIYVNWPKKEVAVVLDGNTSQSEKEILQIIKEELAPAFPLKPARSLYSYLIKGLIGTVFGLALLIVMAFGMTIPLIGMYLIAGISSLLTLFLGYESYKSAVVKFVKTRKLTMDALFTVSTLTALAVSIAAFFVPWLPMMFDVALLIFGFRHIGTAIEEAAKRKVMKGIAFRDRIPTEIEQEEIDSDGKIIKKMVSVNTLKSGDTIIVRRGEIIPVDGICEDEESYLYETIYNGNTNRIKIKKNHTIFGGMKVGENVNYMKVKVTASAEDSYPARVDKQLDDSQTETAPIENTADKILRYFVPAVFGLALVSGIIISCFFPPAVAIQCAVSTLVSACPCTLGFIIPLAVNIGISKGRDNNVAFKGGKALQAAAEIDTVVFDLNGTLTTGEKKVTNIDIKEKNLTEAEIADYLYYLERKSKGKHVIAAAIYRYAKKHKSKNISKKIVCPVGVKNNSGVCYEIDGDEFSLGNSTMMIQSGVDMSSYKSGNKHSAADQMVYLARNKKIIAVINITDPIRKDAKNVIQQLQQSGKKVYICTGTDKNTARAYANKLGIDPKNIRSDCIPFEDESSKDKKTNPSGLLRKKTKTAVIQALKKQGHKVAFVGDGGNDALVMNECFGIAMQSQASDEVTIDNADAVVNTDSLKPILSTFAIAKQTNRNIKLSLGISLAYNMTTLLVAGGVLVAIGFTLNPAIGVALMIIQACLILAMAYHFKRKQLPQIIGSSPAQSSKNLSTNTLLNKFFKPKQSNELVQNCKPKNPTRTIPFLTRVSTGISNLFRNRTQPHPNTVLTPLRTNTQSSPKI